MNWQGIMDYTGKKTCKLFKRFSQKLPTSTLSEIAVEAQHATSGPVVLHIKEQLRNKNRQLSKKANSK